MVYIKALTQDNARDENSPSSLRCCFPGAGDRSLGPGVVCGLFIYGGVGVGRPGINHRIIRGDYLGLLHKVPFEEKVLPCGSGDDDHLFPQKEKRAIQAMGDHHGVRFDNRDDDIPFVLVVAAAWDAVCFRGIVYGCCGGFTNEGLRRVP